MKIFKTEKPKWQKRRWISALDLLVLMDNVITAANDDTIGFEDTREMVTTFLRRLNHPVRVYTDDLESCLWSCNLLNEKKGFKHPLGISFDDFLKKALRGDKFNKQYNYIEGDHGGTI